MFGNVKYRFKACELTGKDLIELRAHFLSLRGVSKRFANIAVSSRAARTLWVEQYYFYKCVLKARDPAHLTRPQEPRGDSIVLTVEPIVV